MTDVRIVRSVSSVQRATSDDSWGALRGTRDGAAFVADWKQALIMEGRGYHVDVGAFSTPLTGGGTSATVMLQSFPAALISVPNGTAILPTRVNVVCRVPASAADLDEVEILVAADIAAAWDATGTATAETAINLRSDAPNSSNCTCKSMFSAIITTAPVLGLELMHAFKVCELGTSVGVIWSELNCLYEPKTVPILMGPAMLLVYWGGTVATWGFAQIDWLELPETAFA